MNTTRTGPRGPFVLLAAALFALLAAGGGAAQDVVELRNGDRLSGTVTSVTAERVLLSGLLGDVEVPVAEVATLTTAAPVTLLVEGAEAPTTARITALSDGMLQVGEGETARAIPIADLRPLPPASSWTGSLVAGAAYSDGNTDRRAANASGEAIRRGEHDRITLKGFWTYSEEKDDTGDFNLTERRLGGSGQYDRFLSERFYLYGSASALRDDLARLDLRVAAGVGAGYQFLEREDLKLSAEAGLSYVVENYEASEDDDYLSARVAVDVAWTPTERTSLLHTTEWLQSLEDEDDSLVTLDTRGRLTITGAMFTQLQWLLFYDNTPATGADRIDQQLLLQVGWSF